MKNEMSKGFYAMQEKILTVLKIMHEEQLTNYKMVWSAINIIVKTRIGERGDLGGESFKNMCTLEAELIIKKFYLTRVDDNESALFKGLTKRIEELHLLIENLQPLVSQEFNAKSDILESKIKRQREKEKRKDLEYEAKQERFKNDLLSTLVLICLSLVLIPAIFFIMKGV